MKPGPKKYFLILLILTILTVSLTLGFLKPVETVIIHLTKPLASVFYSATQKTKNWLQIILEPGTLHQQNLELKQKIADLQQEINQLNTFKLENEQLKTALDYRSQLSRYQILAKIIGRWDLSGKTFLNLDQGSKAGVKPGQLVTTVTGELLGEIIETSVTSSKMRLITDPDFKIAIKKAGTNEVIGILRGNFALSLAVELIPNETDIKIGDEVVTANLQERPADIRIGIIDAINKDQSGLFQSAVINAYFNLEDIIFANIIND